MAILNNSNGKSRIELQDFLQDLARKIYNIENAEPTNNREIQDSRARRLDEYKRRLQEVKDEYRALGEDPEEYVSQIIENLSKNIEKNEDEWR